MFRLFSVFLVIILAAAFDASASVGDRLSFTSESAALAGARTGSREFSSASAYENPAQLSLFSDSKSTGKNRIQFHWSGLYSKSFFQDIDSVVTQNVVNSDANDPATKVNTDYPATFGQSIGFSVQSLTSPRRWGFGAVAYLPLDRLALVESGESFVPEYTLHRGSNQRPEFHFAASGLLLPNLSLGLGLQLGSKLDLGTTIFLNQGAGTASSMRISASLKTKASLVGGVSWIFSDALSFGLNFRLPSAQPQVLNVTAGARAIGTVNALDFSFPAVSTMYYDPFTLQLGTEWKSSATRTLFLQLDYQAWSKFESPTIRILDPQTSTCAPNCGVKFVEGRNLAPKTRDLWIPRVGHSWKWEDQTIRLGYTFRQSIYKMLPTEAGNAIDPDEHRVGLGYGREFDSFLVFDAPGRMDLHVAYSYYRRSHVEKSPGDENGDLANRKVGAPGYDIGGHALGAGVSVQFDL